MTPFAFLKTSGVAKKNSKPNKEGIYGNITELEFLKLRKN